MENNNQEQKNFSYTYSAKEREELHKIREKYVPQPVTESKIERLRRLDASVAQTAQIVALIIGIAGTLVLGFGMSLCMTELSQILGKHQDMAMTVGIIIGILGGGVASLAYPVYNAIVKEKRKKLAPEIIRLTDELMK